MCFSGQEVLLTEHSLQRRTENWSVLEEKLPKKLFWTNIKEQATIESSILPFQYNYQGL